MDKLVFKYGGGVNTWAGLVLLQQQGRRPDAIVMSDPGDEWKETIDYRDGVGREWLRSVGFPDIVTVSRYSEGPFRKRHIKKTETLLEECERLSSPPSAAYGLKRCSMVYKAEPSFWYLQRKRWAYVEHIAGRRIAVAICYDVEEESRYLDSSGQLKREFTSSKTEAEWCYPVYPLVEAGMDRRDCESIIIRAGLPLPRKSACKFCPFNKLQDWYDLARDYPNDYLRYVELSRRSADNLTSESTGFLRGFMPSGKRQLHIWHDGGYDSPPPPVLGVGGESDESDNAREIPCECAL